ncbi:unnamed protein product [Rotaria socialis]|uniref:acylaminoacyl-peptidase n=2 Tax=Rotaria TaxID=231623 RepID=A0A818RPT0_9BILA|nr:unnamed protein product [Rotaria socialis]CAF3327853.1 unnamed protein product [Rotaria socialis]CAF3661370.1 unnamed protein product [Rotaria socialis]CAF3736516.1 unnamed protein product [Rotaria socialis]CAF3741129.1 unnamed protein product [Rotaria socialis]
MTTTDNKILTSAIESYRRYAGQPTLSNIESCRQDSNDEIVHLTPYFSTMDLVKLEDLTYTRSFTYSLKTRQLLFTSNVTPINKNIVRRLASPDGKYVALVTKDTKGEQELQYVQIWHDEHLIFGYEVSDSKISPHGKILPKNDYASFFEWSPDSRRLVFTAEEKRKPLKSYFTADKLDEIGEPASVYRENWGEQMEAFETSVVCIFDLDTKKVQLIENQPNDLYIGQSSWTTNPDELIFVAFRLEPYRLGLIYCENRPSALFKCNWRNNEWKQLTEFDQLCRLFPRHLPKTDNEFVYVQTDAYRAHAQCKRLVLFNTETQQEKILIDRVDNVTYSNADPFKAEWDTQFKGLYMSPPRLGYSSDGRYLLLPSLCGSRNVLYVYDFVEQNIIPLDSPLGVNTSMIGLGVFGHYVAVNVVDYRTPYRLYVFDLKSLSKKEKDPSDWYLITEHEFKTEEKNSIEWNVDRFFPDNELIPVESVYVHVRDTQAKRPLMVLVHGGPNSNVPMNYYIGVIAYVALGFDMLIVNYRGSIGFGQASVDKLLGNISKTDVQDCHEAIHRCLQHTEPSRSVILIGGSHAGVIIGRLIGEYPTEYAVSVLRNPVMDLLHTYITSDIPDWALAQSANMPFDFETGRNRFSNTSLITYLIERSSIRLMDQIKTPVLLQLGKKDKRVPFSVGLRYYECLKANKIPTKLYVYDSNHALSETSCASDCFVNTILFIHEHLNLSS